MIIVLVLGLLLALTLPLLEALHSSWNARSNITTVYQKERALIFLNSALQKTIFLLNRDTNGYDGLNEIWSKPFEMETPLGTVSAQIVDLDRYININRVGRDPKLTEVFKNLLYLLDVDEDFLTYLYHWTGIKRTGERYVGKYPVKGRPLDSIYEVQYFWNNTGDLYGKREGSEELPGLLEFITVHSEGKININTAPYWIVRSLLPDMDEVLAHSIIEERLKNPFKSIQDLLRVDGMTMDILYRIQDVITFRSRFFKITLTLKSGERKTQLEAIYDRLKKQVVEKTIY